MCLGSGPGNEILGPGLTPGETKGPYGKKIKLLNVKVIYQYLLRYEKYLRGVVRRRVFGQIPFSAGVSVLSPPETSKVKN